MTSLAQLERGVVGYWCPMLQTTGLRLYDRSVRKNHGTLTSMDAATDWVTASVRGRSGRVLDFDGVNDRIVTSSVARTLTISIGLWLKIDYANSDTFARFLEHGLNQSITVCLNKNNAPNKLTVQLGDGGTAATWTENVSSTWENYSVSVSHAGGVNSISLYRNGVFDNTASKTITPSGSYAWFLGGCDSSVTSVATPAAQIAETCLWNRALTASEWGTLYRLGPGWFGRREPRRRYAVAQAAGFKAYWARRQTQIIGGGF